MAVPFAKKIRMWSSAVAIAAGMGLGAAGASAQATPRTPPSQTVAAMPTKYVVRNTVFHLPFKIGAAAQTNAREMQLWMCDNAGHWKLADRVPPNAGHFTCRVPHEGEYGFSIVTVDRRGVPSPRNVTQRRPELMVIVDMRSQPAAPPVAAPGYPSSPSVRPLPAAAVETIVPAQPTPGPAVNSPLPNMTETIVPISEPGPLPFAGERLPGMAAGNGMSVISSRPASTPVAPLPATRRSSPAPEPAVSEIIEEPSEAQDLPGANTLSVTDRTVKGPAVLLVNDTHVSVEYNVGKSGPSGLAKVLIYGTTDQGRTWECLGEDADHRSPAEINLPGEGIYGIRMSGVNGNGFGGKAPAAGEQPSTTIEVDLTRPKLHSFKTGLAKSGQLDIRWKVTDKNLGNQSVNLFYRTSRKGAWKPLVAKLKGEGNFRWSITQDLAPQYYIRLEATDLAGNVISCESQNPVLVDRTEPDINVTGITVIQRQGTGSNERLVPAGGETHDDEE
jgi:hypothetical protein